MEVVKQFNSELSSLYETKPPISKAKMTSITRTAIKAIKLYKHVVQSVEKFIQKCKPEYKVPGLYVIDSIVRQSRHQFGTEKDVFAPRFARNLQQTFVHLFNCPPDDKSKVIRVLNLWQKNSVFESDVIQPLFDLADPNHPVHKEQAALAPTNGITTTTNVVPKTISSKKEGGTAGWVSQLPIDPPNTTLHSSPMKPHVPSQLVDVNILQQLQHLQTLLRDQQSEKVMAQNKEDQVKFDKKLLDFDYGEEEDEIGTPAQHQHHHQQQQVVAGLDSIGSILSNPEVLRQLQTLQQTLSNPQQLRQQQFDMEEKMRKMQEMKQQEEEFDKHLAQTVPNLPFADQCELKPGGEMSGFPGMDMSQPPPGYPQQKLMVPPGMMLKPPPSPLEDGEHASSDADERMGHHNDVGGPSVVVLDSDSPSDSPAHRRRRRRSRSNSRSRRSRSDSRSRSRSKRKRSSSYDDKDWDRVKQREAEKEKERERKRKGLPTIKKHYLAVCSTTLWIGHLSKLVQQEELSDTFGEFGDIVEINLIPPRGCAFICMNRRQDAYRALQDLRHHKLQGKAITLAWAPGKGMKGKEYKDYWEVEQGVSYIPWSKLSQDINLDLLEEGGMIDEESLPEWLKEKQKKPKGDDQNRSQNSSKMEDDEKSKAKGPELDIPVPAPTLPGYIPLPEGPQPNDIKVSQPPPTLPPMMAPAPPLGMMPPFGLPNVPREYSGLLGPMGMAMGPPGLMPNVPLGVPPPGLMSSPLMHQSMLSRMPQPVGSPFNPPPGVGLLGGHHPQLSQIPLPGSQDKPKASLPPLAVPPPSDPFGDAMMQIPFTLPPQLQMPGMSMMTTRPPVNEKLPEPSTDNKDKSPLRNDSILGAPPPFGQPPPLFSPTSLMKIPPPMSIPPPNKSEPAASSADKDERENKDKDYRESMKDYKDRDKDRDRDYRNKRDRDYRGDRDYRDRFDKDYRERDKDYREKDRERKDRRERSRERDREDKTEQDFREKEAKFDEKDRNEDKNYRERERSRNRDRDRDRDRDRGRDRMNKWGDRDRDRGRDRERDERRGRERERDRSKEMKNSMERERSVPNVQERIQERIRSMALEQERESDFARGPMDTNNFQGQGGMNFGPRNDGFGHDGFPDMHGRHPNTRRDGFDNRGPRDMYDHRGPPPDRFDPRGPPPDGFGPRGGPPGDNFGPRGPPDGFALRGPPPENFGPRGPPPENFGHRGPPENFGPRGHPPDNFGPRGPPPENFGPRGHPPGNFGPPEGFDHRGPPPEGFDHRGPPPEGFDPRGPPPDFDGQPPQSDNFQHRGPPDNFNRGLLPDNFGPGGPPEFMGPPGDEFGPHGRLPFEGFGGPHGPPGDFQPRIRIEFFARGRGRGGLQDNFRGRGSPRGGRGLRPGPWMENQGPSPPKPGFGFPHRGFAPESSPERFPPPVFEDIGRGRGGQNLRGRGRGFPPRQEEHRKDDDEADAPSFRRLSRWSNPSPPSAVTEGMNEKESGEEVTSDIQTIDMQNVNSSDSSILGNQNIVSSPKVTSEVDTGVQNERDIAEEHSSEHLSIPISIETAKEDNSQTVDVSAELQTSFMNESTSHDSNSALHVRDDDPSFLQSSTNDNQHEQRMDPELSQNIHSFEDVDMPDIQVKHNENERCIKETPSFSEGGEISSIMEGHDHFDVEKSVEMSLDKLPLHEQNYESVLDQVQHITPERSVGPETSFELDDRIEAPPLEQMSLLIQDELKHDQHSSVSSSNQEQHFSVGTERISPSFKNPGNGIIEGIEQRLPLAEVTDNLNDCINHETVDFDDMSFEPPPNDMSLETPLSDMPSQDTILTDVTSFVHDLNKLSQSVEENSQ